MLGSLINWQEVGAAFSAVYQAGRTGISASFYALDGGIDKDFGNSFPRKAVL